MEKSVEIHMNKSLFYVLPVLDKYINFKFLDYLHNSYVNNNDKDKEFCVLYQFCGFDKDFIEFEAELFKSKYYISHEDHDKYVLYKFKLPKEVESSLAFYLSQKVNLNTLENKHLIKDFAKKRGFANPEAFNKFLKGTQAISEADMKKETFSNWVTQVNYVNANDLYNNNSK